MSDLRAMCRASRLSRVDFDSSPRRPDGRAALGRRGIAPRLPRVLLLLQSTVLFLRQQVTNHESLTKALYVVGRARLKIWRAALSSAGRDLWPCKLMAAAPAGLTVVSKSEIKENGREEKE